MTVKNKWDGVCPGIYLSVQHKVFDWETTRDSQVLSLVEIMSCNNLESQGRIVWI